MTPEACRNGTERCAAALATLPGFDVVVNLQGDAPLTPPWFVGALVEAMQADPARMMATPVLRCDAAALEGFLDDRRHGRVGATTAVFDRDGRALYFSKEVIPFTGGPLAPGDDDPGLPPCRRLRLPPRGARRLSGLAGRAARALRGARAASLPRERRADPLRRGRGARARLLGAQQPQRRAADRGDPARAGPAVTLGIRLRRSAFARL